MPIYGGLAIKIRVSLEKGRRWVMDEIQRRRLTEFLCECWHRWKYIDGPVKQEEWQCVLCGIAAQGAVSETTKNRTFTEPADFFAVQEAIVKAGKWNEFFIYARLKSHSDPACFPGYAGLFEWLLSKLPDGTYRLCELAAEWIKEGK